MGPVFDFIQLSVWELAFLAGVMFAAGFVRGFTGFALSALAMVIAGPIFGPLFMIPVLFWQELSSSLMMRAGWADADKPMVFLMVTGSAIAVPLGLWLTLSIPADVSAIVALALIMGLAIMQLARVRMDFLTSTPGTFATGAGAGLVSGLSGAGGMVVALFVLASDRDAKTIRASLVLYLLLWSFASFATYILMGVMTWPSVVIGLLMLPPCLFGVVLGQRLFVPKYEKYYRPVCLSLLVGIAAVGLANKLITGA